MDAVGGLEKRPRRVAAPDDRGEERRPLRDAARSAEPCRVGVLADVERCERHVERVLRERREEERARVVEDRGLSDGTGDLAERLRPPLREHRRRRLHDRMKETDDMTGFVADRAHREREKGLLRISVPLEQHSLVLEKARLTGAGALERLADAGHVDAHVTR